MRWLGPKFEELPDYKGKYARAKSWLHYNKQIYNLKISKYSWHSVENIWRQVVNWLTVKFTLRWKMHFLQFMACIFNHIWLYSRSNLDEFATWQEKKRRCKRYTAWLWHGNKAQEFFCMKRAILGLHFALTAFGWRKVGVAVMIVILAKIADGDGWVWRRGDCSDVLDFCVLHVWCVSVQNL